jgi:glycerate dehydrogenase
VEIVVLDGYTLNPGDNPWDPVERLGNLTVYDRTPGELIVERARVADIVLTNKTPLSEKALNQLPLLKFISVLATGYNVVDTGAARLKEVSVSNVPVYGTDSVAQFVFSLILNLVHRPQSHDRAVRREEWARRQDFSFWTSPVAELSGKKMGIVGFGRIGRRTAEIAHAFGMEVLAFDVFQANPPEYAPFGWRSIEKIFEESDVISLQWGWLTGNFLAG